MTIGPEESLFDMELDRITKEGGSSKGSSSGDPKMELDWMTENRPSSQGSSSDNLHMELDWMTEDDEFFLGIL